VYDVFFLSFFQHLRLSFVVFTNNNMGVWRPHIGANGVSSPPGKMDEKLKSKNM